MTGEVTLRGRVLKIGGIKEKTIAALRAGCNTVLLPQENVKDLEKIPKSITKSLTFMSIDTVDQVLEKAINDFNSQVKVNQQQQEIQPSVDTTPAPLQGEKSPLPPSSSTGFQTQPYLYDMLSSGNTQPNVNEQVVIQGHTYRRVNHTRVHIRTSEHTERMITNSLIDGGANGALEGSDVRLLETTDRLADDTGIDGHVISNIPWVP
jgi:hypothetical protein